MSFNGSGTFLINSSGQPVVTGTVISSTAFNSLTADLGTGLSTTITKDGQTTTTAKIPFAFGLSAAAASNFPAGTVAAPGLYLSTDTGTGLYRIGANNDGFAVSGTKLLDLSAATFAVTGAVTISTTLGVTGVISANDATASSSKTTGALVVAGGIGIGKNSFLSGGFFSTDSANNTTSLKVSSTRTTAAFVLDAALETTLTAMDIKSTEASTGGTYIAFTNVSNAAAGSITHNGTTTVNYGTSSDKRLKNDLGETKDVSVILDTVIHDFEWKNDGNKLDRGVFAQEAYNVKPSAVTVGGDDVGADGTLLKPWSVDYSKYVPDLIVISKQMHADLSAIKSHLGM
jgi:hypothetical protein